MTLKGSNFFKRESSVHLRATILECRTNEDAKVKSKERNELCASHNGLLLFKFDLGDKTV